MSESVVYLVVTRGNYEGYGVLLAFEVESDANAFRDVCRAHEAKRPPCPHINDGDDRWGKWNELNTAWQRDEPKGFYSIDGNFEVATLPLVRSRPILDVPSERS